MLHTLVVPLSLPFGHLPHRLVLTPCGSTSNIWQNWEKNRWDSIDTQLSQLIIKQEITLMRKHHNLIKNFMENQMYLSVRLQWFWYFPCMSSEVYVQDGHHGISCLSSLVTFKTQFFCTGIILLKCPVKIDSSTNCFTFKTSIGGHNFLYLAWAAYKQLKAQNKLFKSRYLRTNVAKYYNGVMILFSI